jgi:hypothetical protein
MPVDEWDEKYPHGVDGKRCVFNAIGGVLNYAMVDMEKTKKAKKQLDPKARFSRAFFF